MIFLSFTSRHPDENRDPPLKIIGVKKWIPIFIGMTAGELMIKQNEK